LGSRLAWELGLHLLSANVGAFADGETKVHVADDVRGADVFILQPTCTSVNDHLIALALLADATKAAGAARVTAVVPYFGYARQEQRSRRGDARSAQVVAKLLGAVGIDHLITLDLHAPALESALPMPTTQLTAEAALLPYVKSWGLAAPVVVSPDAGGLKRAQRFAMSLDAPLAVIAKRRPQADVSVALQVVGDVEDRVCLLVDDMASTGNTLGGSADALRRAGAREVHCAFTHAVMAPGAEERLLAAQFGHILTTDSVPISSAPWLEVAPIAPLLAGAIREVVGNDTSLRGDGSGTRTGPRSRTASLADLAGQT
jgi:ribose-phosphate pyrophosphokinase